MASVAVVRGRLGRSIVASVCKSSAISFSTWRLAPALHTVRQQHTAAAPLASTNNDHLLHLTKQNKTRPTATGRAKTRVTDCAAGTEGVAVAFADGRTSQFDHLWLRDNCRCSKCLHAFTKQRLIDTYSIPTDVAALEVRAGEDGLAIRFSDGHQVDFPSDFLFDNAYNPPLKRLATSSKKLWGAEVAADPPRVRYEEVMEEGERGEAGLLQWLRRIDEYGFCLIEGIPPTPEATEALVQRIAFIRQTHYGGFWDFTANLEHGDMAYTDLPLPAHTDTTYFSDPAGLQLFHLLSPATSHTGGASLLVDGFHVADQLSTLSPDAYAALTEIPVRAHASGGPDVLVRPSVASPVLTHDPLTGELETVRWNAEDRRTIVPRRGRAEDVRRWYRSARVWEGLLRSPQNEFWMQMKMGEALIFDNHRVLHGRSAFAGERRLCGAYVGRDDWRSKLRVLERKLGGVESAANNLWADID